MLKDLGPFGIGRDMGLSPEDPNSDVFSGCGREEAFAKSTESIDFMSTNSVETPRGSLQLSVRD